MGGPPPKPTEAKRLAGNPGKRHIPDPIVVIEGSVDRIPDAPSTLGAEGKARWNQVWSTADKWLVPTTDMALLVRYCEAIDARTYWKSVIKKEGRMSRGSTGQPKVHPAVEELGKIDDRLLRWESELGFTPVGRARLHIEKRKPEPVRKLDRFVAKTSNQG